MREYIQEFIREFDFPAGASAVLAENYDRLCADAANEQDQINAIYEKSIDITVESAAAVSENLIGEITGEDEESTSIIDEAKEFLTDVSGSVAVVIEQFKNVLNRFVEATAVMIVTTCLIPVLVILFFVWVVKTLFGIPIVIPALPGKPKRKPLPYGYEDE